MLILLEKYGKDFIGQFGKLSNFHQVFVLKFLIDRHYLFVKKFDERYGKNTLLLFASGVKFISDFMQGRMENPEKLISFIMGEIPDTEEFSGVEASLAQNSLISVVYGLQFCKNFDLDNAKRCIEMLLNNIDIINMEKNENYDEQAVFHKEIKIVTAMIDIVKNNGDLNECEEFILSFPVKE